jgi:hypothetical protein
VNGFKGALSLWKGVNWLTREKENGKPLKGLIGLSEPRNLRFSETRVDILKKKQKALRKPLKSRNQLKKLQNPKEAIWNNYHISSVLAPPTFKRRIWFSCPSGT